jgi:hypothetical protein
MMNFYHFNMSDVKSFGFTKEQRRELLTNTDGGIHRIASFQAGDKVRIKDCPETNRTWSQQVLPVGMILTVKDSGLNFVRFINPIPGSIKYVPFLQIAVEDVEFCSGEAGTHPCHCPPENFQFNGVGCQCGGI